MTAESLDELLDSPPVRDARLLDTRAAALAERRFDLLLRLVALRCRTEAEDVELDWLRRQALDWWAEGMGDAWTEDGFRDLVDQLCDLRLLRRVAPGRLVLHNPNLLPELGTEEELVAELTDYIGLPPDAVGAPDPRLAMRAACAAAPAGRSVLTAQQRGMLERSTAPVAVIFGSELAALSAVPACLAGHRRVVELEWAPDGAADTLAAQLASEFAAAPDELRWLLFRPAGRWDGMALAALGDAMREYPAGRAVVLADPAATWHALQSRDRRLLASRLAEAGVDAYTLAPWQSSVLGAWLRERPALAERGLTEDSLLHSSGGWPRLLAQLEQQPELGPAQPWLDLFGVLEPAVTRVLRPLAELHEASGGGLCDLLDADDAAQVDVVLEWARLLHLAQPLGADRWRLDPLLAQLLRSSN